MKYYGNYRGVIFRRDHPTKTGMVKVWVPAVHREIYESDITRIDSDVTPQSKIGDFSKEVVDFISSQIPWSEVAQPLIGGGGSYHVYGGQKVFGDGYVGFDGTIPVSSDGKVNPEDVRAYFIGAIANSQLNGLIPTDAEKFNIDGSPESWANFFVALGYKESNFKVSTKGDLNSSDIPSGSHGLYQLSPEDGLIKSYNPSGDRYSIEQLQDPKFNIDATIRIAEKLLRDHNVIAGGSDKGLSRYWGPLRRGQVTPPPVPDTPPKVVNITPTQSPASTFTRGEGDGTFSVNSGVNIFCGSRNDLKEQTGSFSSGVGNRKISLDFNASGGNSNASGFEVLVPNNATSTEISFAKQYLSKLDAFFKAGGISRRNRGVKFKNFPSSNPVIFTEPFFNTDTEAINYLVKNIGEYNRILLETLGRIPGSTLIAPHENTSINTTVGGDRVGATLKYNGEVIGEREFAMRYILRPLAGGKTVSMSDGFSSVGDRHPEEIRDSDFLKSLDISESEIEKTIEIGKKIFDAKKLSKAKPTKDNVEAVKSLKEERDKIWSNIKIDGSDKEVSEKKSKINEFRITNELDYSSKPLNNNVNPASHTIAHSTYNNVSRGSFTIPDLGAKVWVFFEGGDIDFPVVFANNPDQQDYAGVFDISSPSPDYPENNDDGDEASITRGKSVINSRGGSFEVVDTTGRERVKLTSFHGGSYDMNQMGTTEFAAKRKTLLVRGDQFRTIKGDDNKLVEGDFESIVKGDIYHKYGNIKEDYEIAKQIKELHTPIHHKQQTFDVKRADSSHPLDSSPLQTKSGNNAECPVCSGKNKFKVRVTEPSKFTPARGKKEKLEAGKSDVVDASPSKESCLNCGGSGVVPWSAEGNFEKEPLKKEIVKDINNISTQMSELESKMGSGGNVFDYISKSHTVFIGTEMNDLGSIRVDPLGKRKMVGQVPSSDGKAVVPVYKPTPHVEGVSTNSLAGGNYSMMVANKYSLFVGSNGIEQKTTGPLSIQGRIMTISGDQLNISSNNEILIDGGSCLDLTADVINIRPRNGSVGGQSMRTLSLDSSVSISSNMVSKGMMHVEGGVSTQHITAPLQYSETETTRSTSDLIGGIVIGKDADGRPVTSVAVKGFSTSDHSHIFPTAASTLLDTNDQVRQYGSAAASPDPVIAPPVIHTKSRNRDKQVPIRFPDPNLFALTEDCDDSEFNRIVDLISDSDKSPLDIREDFEDIFTKASDFLDGDGCIPCV